LTVEVIMFFKILKTRVYKNPVDSTYHRCGFVYVCV